MVATISALTFPPAVTAAGSETPPPSAAGVFVSASLKFVVAVNATVGAGGVS